MCICLLKNQVMRLVSTSSSQIPVDTTWQTNEQREGVEGEKQIMYVCSNFWYKLVGFSWWETSGHLQILTCDSAILLLLYTRMLVRPKLNAHRRITFSKTTWTSIMITCHSSRKFVHTTSPVIQDGCKRKERDNILGQTMQTLCVCEADFCVNEKDLGNQSTLRAGGVGGENLFSFST